MRKSVATALLALLAHLFIGLGVVRADDSNPLNLDTAAGANADIDRKSVV